MRDFMPSKISRLFQFAKPFILKNQDQLLLNFLIKYLFLLKKFYQNMVINSYPFLTDFKIIEILRLLFFKINIIK